MKHYIISGYRSYELGIFQENDPKISIIKKVLKNRMSYLVECGVDWFLISGNLGTEIWAAQVIIELKKDYPEIKLAIFFPYEQFYQKWNEKNQAIIQEVLNRCDYQNYVSKKEYYSPQQLKNHTQFLMAHSDGCLLLYDTEFEGKPKYLYEDAINYSGENLYDVQLITMDELQNVYYDDTSD